MVIPAALRDEIVAHARAGLPNEACGILAGRDDRVDRFFPAQPDEPSPYYYRIDARDQIRIMNEIDDAGLDLVGIYHSHVSSPAYPSRTDAEQAFWPDAVYVIVSLAGQRAEMRGYRIVDMAIDRGAAGDGLTPWPGLKSIWTASSTPGYPTLA